MATAQDYRTVEVAGRSIEYKQILRSGSVPTVVLLHEGLGCVAMWRDFPERLAEMSGCSVLVYSRFGYGGSSHVTLPRPLDHMRIEAQEFLPALLGQFDIENPVLLGHSDGATIALENASYQPQNVRGVIAIAPHVFVEQLSIDSISESNSRYVTTDLRMRLQKYHHSNVDCAFRGWAETWLNPGFRDWNIEPILSRIIKPMLLIQGQDDRYGTLEQVERIAAQVSGDVQTLILERCGHAPQFEKPQETLNAICTFLKQI